MYKEKYDKWMKSEKISAEDKKELESICDEKELEDRFYKDLEFGTGGLRGAIGMGSNRMNIYTVSKATQGLSDYLNESFKEPSVAIAYDSRNMSYEFAKATAMNFAANNIKVYLYEGLRPTPMLSFAVRYLNCQGGVVVTASHNPKEYNGYKVYNEFGGQITDEKAKLIINKVNEINDFDQIKYIKENEAVEKGLINYIGEEIDRAYCEYLKSLSIRNKLVDEEARNIKIIYTPIHGTGNIPVRRVLGELGYSNLLVVKEQELPNGEFPTAAYPNPEDPKVFKLALEMANKENPDIIFGTDPDADRIGVVVKDNLGEYRVLTGNQTGLLLTEYILKSLKEENKLPGNGVVIKTIVTTEGVGEIAKEYGVEILDVLTGFKYIGEKITEFEKINKKYIFGFEESYGYLYGENVRDKDAVVTAMLICEMTLYYKKQGKNLYEALMDLYRIYGTYKEALVSIELKGKEGQEKIASSLDKLRIEPVMNINNVKVIKYFDYKLGIEIDNTTGIESKIDLPQSNVLKYVLQDGSWFVVRPSGTEPKMKIYIAVKDGDLERFKDSVMQVVNSTLK